MKSPESLNEFFSSADLEDSVSLLQRISDKCVISLCVSNGRWFMNAGSDVRSNDESFAIAVNQLAEKYRKSGGNI